MEQLSTNEPEKGILDIYSGDLWGYMDPMDPLWIGLCYVLYIKKYIY